MIEELEGISERMAALLHMFIESPGLGLILPTLQKAKFASLALEAKSIIDDELGFVKRLFVEPCQQIPDPGTSPSYASVEEAVEVVRGAVREIRRKRVRPAASPPGVKPYVDPDRINALQALQDGSWDFTRLVELCREINVAGAHRCHMSTAMLLRTILNHVPPVLGFDTFAEVANSYGGPKAGRSFKACMQRLETSLRNVADMHLHTPIRPSEDVPTVVQVEFAAELDVLLGEVIRVARGK